MPAVSASALMDRIASPDKTLLELPGGHVGAVVSKAAQKKLWPWMSSYWAQRDEDPAAPKPKTVTKPRTRKTPASTTKPRSRAAEAAE